MSVRSARTRAENGVWVSVLAYSLLTVLKLVVGRYTGSLSLQADGFNNGTDLLASATLLAGLRVASRPRDENHPYGHGRAEPIASLITAVIMMAIGVQVLFGAIGRMVNAQEAASPDLLAAWIGAVAAAVMLGVYAYNRALAEQLSSVSLWAMSKDNLSDALVSVGAVVGIVGSHLGTAWLDPLAAMIIGGIICRTSWEVFSKAATILSDGFDETKLKRYRETVLSVPGVHDVGDLRARSLGNDVVVDVTIKVSPTLSVVDSHRIADAIEYELQRRHKVRSTFIHVEPR